MKKFKVLLCHPAQIFQLPYRKYDSLKFAWISRTTVKFFYFSLFTVLGSLIFPYVASAAVTINEVAWMGTGVSANDEWIELRNSVSGGVTMDGWRLSDGMNLEINLFGSLAVGQYAVLERTDDTSAPGQAFLIYTGALPNTGATLTLYRTDNSIEDRVSGGENWESIGGDNTTKETAQYTASGWVTAEATPGSANSTKQAGQNNNDQDDEAGTKSNSSKAKSTSRDEQPSLVKSSNILALSIDVPNTVFVNQPVRFTVVPGNVGQTIMNSLKYTWNFGDINTGKGKEVTHTYAYPGQYIVTVGGSYARHDQVVQKMITVLPIKFSITKNLTGDIQIHNDSPYDVDVSGFSLSSDKTIEFPANSYIPKRGTVTVPASKIASTYNSKQVQLWDGTKNMLAVETVSGREISDPVIPNEVATLVPAVSQTASVVESIKPFSFAKANSQEPSPPTTTSSSPEAKIASAIQDDLVTPDPAGREIDWSIIGLIGIVSFGLLGAFMGSQSRQL